MEAEQEKRVAANESLFRLVNERVEESHDRVGMTGTQDYFCECGDAGCTDRVRLTRDEYERVRSNPRRFAIAPRKQARGLRATLRALHTPDADPFRRSKRIFLVLDDPKAIDDVLARQPLLVLKRLLHSTQQQLATQRRNLATLEMHAELIAAELARREGQESRP